ncbi:hypothetical protein ACHAXR_011012 [Thalassiosira sp. AJA248-18]
MSNLLAYLPQSSIACLSIALASVLYLAVTSRDGIIPGPAIAAHDYIPIVYVTAAAVLLYYIFLFNQSYVVFAEFFKAKKAYREKKIEEKPSIQGFKYGSGNINILAANRCAGNFNEQLAPFLLGLYLYATFVSVKGAATYGWAWLFFRSYYLYVFKRGVPSLFLSTIPAYCCVWAMIGGTVYDVSSK